MANFASHDALCLARRFKVSSYTCGANRNLEKPFRAEWAPEPKETGLATRAQIDRPFTAKENQAQARELKLKPVYVMNQNAIRARVNGASARRKRIKPMGASKDDRVEENMIARISTMFGEVPIRENKYLPPGTVAFVDSKTHKVLCVLNNVGTPPPEDFSHCYEWFLPRR